MNPRMNHTRLSYRRGRSATPSIYTMFWITFLLVVIGLAVLFNVPWKIWRYYNLCRAMRRFPSMVPPHWLIGHLNIIELSQDFADKSYEWTVKNKITSSGFWIGPFNAFVVVADPEHLKPILKTSKSENVYSMLEPWLGRGLLIENGSRWFKNRRLLTPAFHFDVLKPYVHVYNDCVDILLNKWGKCAMEGSTVEVYKTISQLTLDVILRCACSNFSDCQNKSNEYVDAVNLLTNAAGQRFMSPLMTISNFLFFNFTHLGRQYKRALNIVHSHSDKVIRERKASMKKEEGKHVNAKLKCLDFLDVLLLTNQEEGGLSDIEVRYEVDTFVFEGYDTTANALTWTLYCLAKYPEHQAKCRDEIKDVLRGRDHIDYDDLSKLQYIQCCIKESMRLYPPVYNIFRQLSQDEWIGGHYVPKEATLLINIIGIHRSPLFWKDPMEYNPLRFHPDHMTDRHSFSFVPFSAGQRNCIGQNFAFNEEQVVIGSILNKFALEIPDERVKERLEFIPITILRPAEELHLKLTLIN